MSAAITLADIDALRNVQSSVEEERHLARVRGRQQGYIRREGPSWFVTFREYRKNPDTGEWADDRVTEYLGPASLTLKQAEAKAKPFTDRANKQAEKPSINMLVADFIESQFLPMVRRTKKPSGVLHYEYLLKTFVVPGLGAKQLCDVSPADVNAVINRAYKKYSRQTLLHIKNAISAVFRLASKLDLYDRKIPTCAVEIGEVVHERRPTYTTEQLALVLVRLPSPVYEMALLGAEVSLGPAELCGIRLRHANLTDVPMELDGEVIAPHSIAIRENWYAGERATLKTKARRRVVPLAKETSARLLKLAATAKRQDGDAPLFQSRNGTPLDTHNVANRMLRPLGEELGFPVTWYGFRRAHSSLAALTGANVQDRKLVMGHSQTAMSLYYDVQDVERLRGVPDRISERLREAEEKARAEGKLIAMGSKKAG